LRVSSEDIRAYSSSY